MGTTRFYEVPRYYDLALTRDDLDDEAAFLAALLEHHGWGSVHRVVEPACGTGIMSFALADLGYEILGYDSSPAMVAHCQGRTKTVPGRSPVDVALGDMRDTVIVPRADGAVNLVNSLGYCVTDDDVRRHLSAMNRSLVPGAAYVVELSTACDDPANELCLDEHRQEGDLWVEIRWTPFRYDRKRKLRHVMLEVEADDRGRHTSITEQHTLRLWTFEDLAAFADEAGFAVAAAYTQGHRSVDLSEPPRGELGALYYVLVKERELDDQPVPAFAPSGSLEFRPSPF